MPSWANGQSLKSGAREEAARGETISRRPPRCVPRLRRPLGGSSAAGHIRIRRSNAARIHRGNDRLHGQGLSARRGHVPPDSGSRPRLLRVRLELARTLFMAKKDEQADYQFRLAAAEHPSALVARNIIRFREAIRARRAWRFSFDVGFAPDSNINSATDKETVDIYGLPFRLDSAGRARSGTGMFVGGDASIRLNWFGRDPDLRRRLWAVDAVRRPSVRGRLCRCRGRAGVPRRGGPVAHFRHRPDALVWQTAARLELRRAPRL